MKKIPLTRGKFALVDDCDFDELSKHKWHFATVGYACRNAKKADGASYKYAELGYSGRLYMHRVILEARKGQEVDHINFDKLDNRRGNIRIASSRQNKCNRPIRPNNTSGVKGVSWAKRERRWIACINKSVGRATILGYFQRKEDACAARRAAVKEHYGEFAHV